MSVTPCDKLLLDFIAVKESGGNYDAYIGHADAPAGTIVYKTITEIYIFQRQLINQGCPSSAVGRYQFVHPTLNALVTRLDVALTVTLNEELQDEFATQLLEDRGINQWIAGDLSDADFAHNLSCEWASLPDPDNGGKSHYDGIGPNHAGRSLTDVWDVLAAARALL